MRLCESTARIGQIPQFEVLPGVDESAFQDQRPASRQESGGIPRSWDSTPALAPVSKAIGAASGEAAPRLHSSAVPPVTVARVVPSGLNASEVTAPDCVLRPTRSTDPPDETRQSRRDPSLSPAASRVPAELKASCVVAAAPGVPVAAIRVGR
ncbi:hypothetical protein P3T39_002422 [Kitasatospora sp. GP82]|nr:hypothetical protein [Kitasatospora sp. GP82]